ncbi:unnamed protein product [Ostreobium quekettii]|uniref:Uncharacterized protein n=1 Tax=Ostreobium quekettii TaxID=121088 RepID=A0A8S1JBH2_9CHLO|nr:unnamed protein product [Ostreobium quekettii]|eukprot:evm.model.scf_574.3 EVM.evm.TU.scf_574.3   scf_574:20382-23377(+)
MAFSVSSSMMALTAPRAQASRSSRPAKVVCAAQNATDKAKDVAKTAAAVAATALVAGAANALTVDEIQGLSYLQVKGTGIANNCPTLANGGDPKSIKSGTYTLQNMCVEPTKIQVKEESQFRAGETEFVDTKLMTRLTYTLEGLKGKFTVGGSGDVSFEKADEGIDFAPATVQLPGGERVPFLFTLKELNAKGSLDGFIGDFTVPSYRGSSFLDPKGRGGSTGYDTAVALPARGDSDELVRENIKSTASSKGTASFSVAQVDSATGEVVGVFESIQPSDTDLGSKVPKDVKITGLWYGQLS